MKRILIFALIALSLSATAQSKKKKKVIEKAKVEAVEAPKEEQQQTPPPPSYTLSEEAKDKMKYTKTIPIGMNVFVQMVFSSSVQTVRSGAPTCYW